MGKDYDRKISVGIEDVPLCEHIDKTTFPGVQGTPYLNNIAAKAVFFQETLSEEYRDRQFKIVENAKKLAESLMEMGYDVVTGGTDNHMVLINVTSLQQGLTGKAAQKCLEECGIVVDMIHLPYEKRPAAADGIRLGTPIVTKNGMGIEEMEGMSVLIDAVLKGVETESDEGYRIDRSLREQTQAKVKDLCGRFPLR